MKRTSTMKDRFKCTLFGGYIQYGMSRDTTALIEYLKVWKSELK
jgi:hypothetical protein